MFAASVITLVRQLMDKPISSSVPLPQLILGSIALCSMIAYALIRHGIMNKRRSERQVNPTIYLFPYIRERLEGHHGAAGHAGAGAK
jgi:hypothetical protein